MIGRRARLGAGVLVAMIPAGAGLAVADGNVSYSLQILHASDLEGSVGAVEAAPNFAAIIDKLEDAEANSVTISSGDNWIPSPFLSAGGDSSVRATLQSVYGRMLANSADNLRAEAGRTDVSILNVIGVDATAFGNHEFDMGTNAIATIIGPDVRDSDDDKTLDQLRWLGADFPYLSANLDFSADSALKDLYTAEILSSAAFGYDPNHDGAIAADELAAIQATRKIAPAAIIERGGEKIGVVGATTPILAQISSPGATAVKGPGAGTDDMAALAAILQPVIDGLVAQGVDKIIVAAHMQQIALEKDLVTRLGGVDVVIAGGSNTLLADATDMLRPGDAAADGYPVVTRTADGDVALGVNTGGDYGYVGRLVVGFDADGKIVADSIDPQVSGVYATTAEGVAAVWGDGDPFAEGSKGALVKELAGGVGAVIAAKDGNLFGATSVFLEGRRGAVRTEETNLGNLSADANLWYALKTDPTVLVSIMNGGGMRDAIGSVVAVGDDAQTLPPQPNPAAGKESGDGAQRVIETALRLNNGLTLMTLSAEQLKQVVEHGVAATAPGATPGQFIQLAGLSFSYDPDQPPGARVRSLALSNGEG
jgi:2',3'-cyclic-nucleotide 2'-phosphodiesterase (5'-nucleotidase family)